MADIAIGIDLGTSNSCVAVARGGRAEVLPNAYGEPTSASVVAFHRDATVNVGNAAKANIIHDPEHTICSAKRLIGRYFFSEEVRKAQAVSAYRIVEGANHGVRIQLNDETLSLPEISAMVLREMKSIAEASLGQEVTKAVVTVPANFNDNQRQATRDAGRIAGLEVLRLLNEPTAAALAYGFGRGLNQRVAVYDLGGGTFDISILEIGKDVYEVLSTYGDTFLGGDDFDDRLIDLLAEEFLAKEGVNLRKNPYALEKLKIAAENAKKELSSEEEVEIRIPDVVVGDDGEARCIVRCLNRSEYASLVTDLIQRTFNVCDEALHQAGMVARDLDGVILVGGPTRLSMIREGVAEYFERPPKTEVDPDQVVAMGAAIHAASLTSSDPESEKSVLLDVTPLSLQIGVAGGLAETLIERNTPVPIEQTRAFTTFQDYQKAVKIRVYQGESRSAEENELLGQFSFTGFRKAPRGQVKIEVTFEIDTDGIVNVTAQDPETGQQASTQITLTSGLTPEEVDRLAAEGPTDRVQSAPPDTADEETAQVEATVDETTGKDTTEDLDLDEEWGDELEVEEPEVEPPEPEEPEVEPPEPEELVADEASPLDAVTQPRLEVVGDEDAIGLVPEGADGLELGDDPLDEAGGLAEEETVRTDEPFLSMRESLFGDVDDLSADDEPKES